jgi:hypothetical protein
MTVAWEEENGITMKQKKKTVKVSTSKDPVKAILKERRKH